MITDAQLYSLAIFLGSAAMLMIVLYHFLEVNAQDDVGGAELKDEKTGVGAVRPVETS
jgi:oligosaccharyl transferase complex subunit OST4